MLGLMHSALPLAVSGPSATPYLAGTVLGFVVGAAGHLVRSNLLVAAGILLVLISTGAFAFQGPPP